MAEIVLGLVVFGFTALLAEGDDVGDVQIEYMPATGGRKCL